MKEEVKKLIELALNDLRISKKLLQEKAFSYVCFFAQQSVEKLLKAFLLEYKEGYEFTHSISKLLKECITIDSEFETLFTLKIHYLTRYYTSSRYDVDFVINEEESRDALSLAEKVKEFVMKKLEKEKNK